METRYKDTKGTKGSTEILRTDIKLICTEMITEELINKVGQQFFTNLEDKLDNKLAKLDKLDALEEKLSALNSTLISLGNTVNSQKADLQDTIKRCDYLDQNSRNNSIRIYGIPESQEEDLIQVTTIFIHDKLNIDCGINDIDFAFRVGRVDGQNSKARCVIAKFINSWKRSEVLRARKMAKKSGVAIFEDLTQQRYNMLQAAKHKYGKDKAWSTNGKIYALVNGIKTLISNEQYASTTLSTR